MQVLRHAGGNWACGCASADAHGTTVAVAVRAGAVLLRARDGAFLGELRLPGRAPPRTTAVRFNSARALQHLLAVGAEDGSVAVFDVHTRRVVRLCSAPPAARDGAAAASAARQRRKAAVVALCFGADTPDLLFVARADSTLSRYALACVPNGDCVTVAGAGASRTWSLTSSPTIDIEDGTSTYAFYASCIASAPGSPRYLFLGGSLRANTKLSVSEQVTDSAALIAVDTRTGATISTVRHPHVEVIHSMDVFVEQNVKATYLTFISGQCGKPSIAEWREDQLILICTHTSNDREPATSSLVCSSVSWLLPRREEVVDRFPPFILCSTPAGKLEIWTWTKQLSLDRVHVLDTAHSRQIFALFPVQPMQVDAVAVISVSMDRRICMWHIPLTALQIGAEETNYFSLTWESCGFGGRVQQIVTKSACSCDDKLLQMLQVKMNFITNGEDALTGTFLASACGDGDVFIEYLASSETLTPVCPFTVLRIRLPRTQASSPVNACALKFLDVPSDSRRRTTCLLIGTNDNRLVCVPLALCIGTSGQGRAEVHLSRQVFSAIEKTASNRRNKSVHFEGYRVLHIASLGMKRCLSVSGEQGYCALWNISVWDKGEKVSGHLTKVTGFSVRDLGLEDVISCAQSLALRLPRHRSSLPQEEFSSEFTCTGLVLGAVSGIVSMFVLDNMEPVNRPRPHVRTLKVGTARVSCLEISSGGNHVAVGLSDGTIVVLTVQWLQLSHTKSTSEQSLAIAQLWRISSSHTRGVTSISWQNHMHQIGDGNTLVNPLDSCAEDVTSGQLLLSTGGDGISRVMNESNGDILASMRGHVGPVVASVRKSRHVFLTGGDDCSLREWDYLKLPK